MFVVNSEISKKKIEQNQNPFQHCFVPMFLVSVDVLIPFFHIVEKIQLTCHADDQDFHLLYHQGYLQ